MNHWTTRSKSRLLSWIVWWASTTNFFHTRIVSSLLSFLVNCSWPANLSLKKNLENQNIRYSANGKKLPRGLSFNKSMANPPCASSSIFPCSSNKKMKWKIAKMTRLFRRKLLNFPNTPPQLPTSELKITEINSYITISNRFSPSRNQRLATFLIFG